MITIRKLNTKINEQNFQTLSILLIVLGSVIRLYHFILNRSLWLDEAVLSNNIINRSYLDLLQQLDNKQIAPIGFIFIQKILVNILGVNEYAFRLLPTITGILSIIIFYYLLRKIGGEKLAFVGLLFFIFGKYLIYHSTEAKQYYLDVFVYIFAFYYLYFKVPNFNSPISVLTKGLIGAFIIWLSHCSILILTSIGIALVIEILYYRKYKYIVGYLVLCSIWLTSFGINYFVFLSNHPSKSAQVSAFINAGYLPAIGDSKINVLWLLDQLIHSISYPIGITSSLLLSVLFCTGIWYIFRSKQYRLFSLAIPLIIHIILSFLYFYPFGGRFTLYLSAFYILYIGLGLKLIVNKLNWAGIPIAGLAIGLAIIYPVRYSFTPTEFEELKPALEFIQNHRIENEMIYVYSSTIPAFEFYQNKYQIEHSDIIKGSSNRSGFDKDFLRIKNNKRIWLLLSHCNDAEKNYIIDKCDAEGNRIEQFEYGGALSILFMFSDE